MIYKYKYKYKTFKKLAKMCAPPNISIAKISVYFCSKFSYTSGTCYNNGDIDIYLRSKKYYPHTFRANKKTGNINIGRLSRRQTLIFVLAHELRHRWQFKNHKYIGVKYDKRAERDADLWALKILRKNNIERKK